MDLPPSPEPRVYRPALSIGLHPVGIWQDHCQNPDLCLLVDCDHADLQHLGPDLELLLTVEADPDHPMGTLHDMYQNLHGLS